MILSSSSGPGGADTNEAVGSIGRYQAYCCFFLRQIGPSILRLQLVCELTINWLNYSDQYASIDRLREEETTTAHEAYNENTVFVTRPFDRYCYGTTQLRSTVQGPTTGDHSLLMKEWNKVRHQSFVSVTKECSHQCGHFDLRPKPTKAQFQTCSFCPLPSQSFGYTPLCLTYRNDRV